MVDWFCGDKPFPSHAWACEVASTAATPLSVLVFEAASFLNVVKPPNHARLSSVSLIVLDECHHAAKDHPYAAVMRLVGGLTGTAKPRVRA